jgi:rod shape-determining protein MreC
MLLANGDPYHRHVYMTSANRVASAVYGFSNNVTSYFNLRQINDDLNRRNADLESEMLNLREQLTDLRNKNYTDTLVTDSTVRRFEFIVAHVINNSVARPFNYLTINKGSEDGIKPELGVIDRNGVVGIVSVVGKHSARVISLLNPNFRLSCKIKRSENFGSLVWDGIDPHIAMLEELPRHTVYQPGDTIVTSGFSAVFPPGLPVGVIMADNKAHNENFFTLKVKLFTDFSTLSNVQVVVDNQKLELDALSIGEQDAENRKQI